jgi:hypothetical protein
LKRKFTVSLPIVLMMTLCAGAAYAITISNISRGPTSRGGAPYEQQPAAAAVVPPAFAPPIPSGALDPNITDPLARTDETLVADASDANACAAVYPNGKMIRDRPNAGTRRPGSDTCSAVIEMRAMSGNSDIILATAVVAAGDALDCNISAFPSSGYTDDAGEIVFPADNEPTMTDVERVMNEEQKQNAALKIAAGAVVGGFGGNFVGASDTGAFLGTNKAKMQSSVIGALAGAGLMVASTYTGKVAGDTIMSTGVNAAMGGILGNTMAKGRALMIKDCTIDGFPTQCLYGVVQKYDKNIAGSRFYSLATGDVQLCTGNNNDQCELKKLIGYTVNGKYVDDWAANNFDTIRNNDTPKFCLEGKKMVRGSCGADVWVQAQGGGTPLSPVAAMIPKTNVKFGSSYTDWLKTNPDPQIYARLNNGENGRDLRADGYIGRDFYPTYEDAADGGIVDFNNRARTVGTLTGAGAGGALGGFSGYMGATKEVEERWVAAVTSYKDSLQKIYCGTGTRFLGYYNDVIIVPSQKKIQ